MVCIVYVIYVDALDLVAVLPVESQNLPLVSAPGLQVLSLIQLTCRSGLSDLFITCMMENKVLLTGNDTYLFNVFLRLPVYSRPLRL